MTETIQLKTIVPPKQDNSGLIIQLTAETMKERKRKILTLMKKEKIDTLVIYEDLEHSGNFSYLTGFVTRFEEGLLILHQTGEAYLVLGNENTKMVKHSRISAELIHCPFFSLPDQPMDHEQELKAVFQKAGIQSKASVGIVGWKLFTSKQEHNRKLFDVPHYIVKALEGTVLQGKLENRTDLFIHTEYGARTTNNANEIAHYEFGSSLASDCVLETISRIEPGKSELELADSLVRYGQIPNVVPIFATGERFENAYLYPGNKKVKLGDKLSITTGFKGGLASRSGYAVAAKEELPLDQKDYLEKAVFPYYRAVVSWLEALEIGMTGKELYEVVEKVLPKSVYRWSLNPGHLTADEEWLSSPVKEDSPHVLRSGMLLQIDIIPSIAGYAGVGCENSVALADASLQNVLKLEYPELWERISKRRRYLQEVLSIKLPDCVLPLSSGVAYYTPFLLNPELAVSKS